MLSLQITESNLDGKMIENSPFSSFSQQKMEQARR